MSGLKKGWENAKLRKQPKNNKICPVCKNSFYRRGNRISIHKCCSKECMGILKRGKNHHWWRNGKSREPYPLGWRIALKFAIRKRDNFTCQICGTNNIKKLAVHHIDYNKKNLNLNNLITLCASCHSNTTIHRKKWRMYFEKRKKKI